MRFWKPRKVHPPDLISDLKARVFNGAGEPVNGSSATERHQVPAGFEHSQTLTRPLYTGHRLIPLFAHKPEAVWRITDYRINRPRRDLAHDL
jgi:hypothetical protein